MLILDEGHTKAKPASVPWAISQAPESLQKAFPAVCHHGAKVLHTCGTGAPAEEETYRRGTILELKQ